MGALLILFFFILFFSANGDSVTRDEVAHIGAGYSYLTTGDYRLNPEHPPLIKDLSAILPRIFNYNYPYQMWQNSNARASQWLVGSAYIFKSGNNPEILLALSRLPIMIISVLLGLFVYLWSRELYGPKAGILALIFYVFSNNIIANSRYVTTDLGITAAIFINLYLLYRFIKKPNYLKLGLVGLTFGIALVTKFSAVVLLPTYIVILLLALSENVNSPVSAATKVKDPNPRTVFWKGIGTLGAVVVIGIVVTWLYYLPHTFKMPPEVQKNLIQRQAALSDLKPTAPLLWMSNIPILKPVGHWLFGFLTVMSEIDGGRPSFLFGMTSNNGWWYYFPVAIAIKTQLPIIILLIMTFLFRKKLKISDGFAERYLLVLPVVLLTVGMFTKMDLGSRYMLPIYPFVFVFISKWATIITPRLAINKSDHIKFSSWGTVLISGLVGWYVISALMIYPYYPSYYNELVGGPKNGYRYLGSADTDWGQDNKRLKEWVRARDIKEIYFDSTLDQTQFDYYFDDSIRPWDTSQGKPPGFLAVTVLKYFQQSKRDDLPPVNTYEWISNQKPIYNIGNSILIYDFRE